MQYEAHGVVTSTLKTNIEDVTAGRQRQAGKGTNSPRVFDNPVVHALVLVTHNWEGVIRAIAHNQDTMIQGSSTGSLKDTSSIQLELALVSLNGYRHWLVGHCLHQKWVHFVAMRFTASSIECLDMHSQCSVYTIMLVN